MAAFFRTPFFLPWIYPSLVWKVPTEAKEIYLTFDDGPIPGPTEFVIEQLANYNAKATFFCIGDNIRKHPDILDKVRQAGHQIGNHTFNHVNGWKTRPDEYVKQVDLCDQQLTINNSLFRPPFGRITKKQIELLSKHKRIIMWDVLTMDYNKSLSPGRCLSGAIKATRPGSIVVFHDSLKAQRNLEYALPRFLDHFAKAGFVFKPL